MHYLFIGDSHANALKRAIKLGGIQDVTSVDVRMRAGTSQRSKEIDPNLPSLYPCDAVFCCLGGTEYNLLGIIEADRPFDFLFDPLDTVADGRAVMPRSLVSRALIDKMRTTLARMASVRSLFSVPFHYIAPPPPFRRLRDDAQLPTAFQSILERGVSPPALRLKLYKLQNLVMRSECEQLDINFIPAPAAGQDGDGYLRDDCWDRDPTHGNARYGAFVIDEIRRQAHG